MILLKMAFRNLLKQKRRSLFTAVSMILGFVMCSISVGMIEGGFGNIVKAFTGAKTGHVQIHRKGYLENPGLYKNFVWNDDILKIILQVKNVEQTSPRLISGGLAFVDKKTTATQIKGIDPKSEASVTSLDKKVGRGSYLLKEKSEEGLYDAVITNSLAESLNADIGSRIVIISQAADGSIANDMFKVVGILSKESDSLEQRTVFVSLKDAQSFLSLDKKVHEIAVRLNSYKKSFSSSAAISKVLYSNDLKNLSCEPWEIIEQQFYNGMVAKKEGNSIMLFVVMLIVGIGVLNTVLMSILDRMREYGVMKAMGTTPWFIFNSIVLETMVLAVFSTVAGLVLSLLATWPLVVYGITYPEPVSIGGIFIKTLNSEFVLKAFYVPVFVIGAASFFASLYPAYKAAVTDPVKSMRSY